MYASIPRREMPISSNIRYVGRASSLILMAIWLVYAVIEQFESGPPVREAYYQGAMLAIVFIGYAVGWRNELLGGALAIIGTIGFFAVNIALFEFPYVGAVGFAIPGICYLVAHYLDKPLGEQSASEP